MKRSVLAIAIGALAFPSGALASSRPLPTGNASVNQYVETIPTAGGNTPSNAVPSRHRHLGAAVGGGGSTGGGVGTTSGTQSGAASIPASTRTTLVHEGPDGRVASALAQETAPPQRGRSSRPAGVSSSGIGAQDASSSPASWIIKSLTGTQTSGGLGLTLPVVLVATLLVAAALTVLRRRRTS